ncbi:WD40-repeat-containing domain protein [Catenaria anguillulae PL171]|uniref:WD40-repeat-containing domain protein n=1 Tax=Catenaria anguillulae PL171 TaxID=765915 RepID=A0A1Y2HYA7_9FUNG|nr:WD40-repeat-containing domain protein [Catenaria anguillulae PL171]
MTPPPPPAASCRQQQLPNLPLQGTHVGRSLDDDDPMALTSNGVNHVDPQPLPYVDMDAEGANGPVYRVIATSCQVASQLEHTSGITFEVAAVGEFRTAVLSGDWAEAERFLSHPDLRIPASSLPAVHFAIREQQYLELLELGDVAGALTVLRDKIAPLEYNLHRLHELSSYLMYTDAHDLRTHAHWAGAAGGSRALTLQRVQAVIPPSVMVRARRLEHLLSQALAAQEAKCTYHNVPTSSADGAEPTPPRLMSLYEDHWCNMHAHFPSQTAVVYREHLDEVWYLAFSHGGDRLAAAGKDGSTIVWDVHTHRQLHRLAKHDDAVGFLAWSPDDSKLLTCGNDAKLRMWDTATEAVTACGWLPSGDRFVTGGLDKVLAVWDMTGNLIHKWTNTRVTDLQISHDGKTLVTVANQTIRIHDLTSRTEVLSFDDTESVTSLNLSKDGRYLLTNTAGQEIHVWDLKPSLGSPTSPTSTDPGAGGMHTPASTHRSRANTATRHGHTMANAAATSSLSQAFGWPLIGGPPGFLPLNPLNPMSGSAISAPYTPTPSSGIAGTFNNASSSSIVSRVSTGGGTVTSPTAAAATPQLVRKYKGHKQGKFVIRSMFGGASEAFIVSGSEDNCAYVWHRATGDVLAVLEGHTATVNAAAWNPKVLGMVATCSDDNTVRIWMPATSVQRP